MKDIIKNKKILAIIVALFFLAILLFVAGVGRQEPQTAEEFNEEFGPATILNGEQVIQDIGLESFTLFRDDVTYLARNRIEPYQDKANQIVFEISDYQKKDDSILLSGKYEEEPDLEIVFSLELLGNSKITNQYTINGQSGDLALPSTSQDNLFIGSLPSEQDGFTVSYLDSSDTFYITFSRPVDEALLQKVRAYLRANLEEELSFYSFSSLGEDRDTGRIRSFQIFEESNEDI